MRPDEAIIAPPLRLTLRRVAEKVHLPLFLLTASVVLLPLVSPAEALILGMAFALGLGNPILKQTRAITPRLLVLSVVGLGAAMNLDVVAKVGAHGIGYTAVGISLTLTVGILLGRLFRTSRITSLLISVGTAICGGSAIAAAAPTLGARDEEISVALCTVFFLNAIALVLFPWLGHRTGLSQQQFGLWSALAIHDTSSVVGATLAYGPRALQVGTTVKLARALWIVPLTLGIAYFNRDKVEKKEGTKAKRPWFILGFLVASALVTWLPVLRPMGDLVAAVARRTLVLTLFLIGANLTRQAFSRLGWRPFLQGTVLWFLVAAVTFSSVIAGWIH